MKKIGFIDYYISEWHANNYPGWISEICKDSGEDFKVSYAFAEKDISPVDNLTTDEWCKKYDVERCHTISELCEKSDYIIILAPTNPEKHLEYAKAALKYGKRTYIDKTFASNYSEAEEIFKIAKEYSTPFFSTSALRYATELDFLAGTKSLIITGGGTTIEEYIIHQIEMLIKLTKKAPLAVRVTKQGEQFISNVKLESDTFATLVFGNELSFSVMAEDKNGKTAETKISSSFFKGMLKDILRFFNTGDISFDEKETLYVMKLRDGILEGCTKPDNWISL